MDHEGDLSELLRMVSSLAAQPEVFVRQPEDAPVIELVVPQHIDASSQACVAAVLGPPAKEPGRELAAAAATAVAQLEQGKIHDNQTFYCRAGTPQGWWYVWLMPWRRAERTTYQIGFIDAAADAAALFQQASADLFAKYHERVDDKVGSLQNSILRKAKRVIRFDSVYQYFVTPSYYGPDRRRHETPVLSRHAFFKGKRYGNVTGLRKTDYYADRVRPKYRKYLWWLLGLSTFDAITTLYHIFVGGLYEVNPLMQYSMGLSPWLFLGLKLAITATFATLILMHQHFRFFKWLLRAVLLIYLVTDVRALVLLLQ